MRLSDRGAHKRQRIFSLFAITMAIMLIVPGAALGKEHKAPKTVDIQVLGLNDFHGQLEAGDPVASSGFRIGPLAGTSPNQTCIPPACYPAGGAEYLATHLDMLRATNPDNTVFVSAGDLIGATPLISAAFHDEPTIEAFNIMELDYNGVGNHEFDEGVDELLRMQKGGCHPVDGCQGGHKFKGAKFQFLAANVVYKKNNKPIFKPYKIHNFGHGVKVAFVGMTLEGTPLIVSPDGISMVNFLDEAETVNRLVPELKKKGADVIVVLLHEGGTPSNTGGNPELINTCNNPSGALPPIVEAMSDEVDIVITGHTNWAVNCLIDGKVVTGAASQARLITDIDFSVDHKTGSIVGPIMVNNKIVTQDVPKDPRITALIDNYNAVIAPIRDAVVGAITGPLLRATNFDGESTIGRLIADAQLSSSQAAGAGGQIALMNPGGIRADLNFTGPVTHGQAFSVQPFSNIVTTKTFTGAQLKTILEQQFYGGSITPANPTGARTLVLPVSAGFTYSWSATAPFNSKISNMMLNGVAIDPAGSYRVTANNFLAGGGDNFPGFTVGTNEQTGADDLVALEAYLGANSPYTPIDTANTANRRITRLP
ncbi:bifunctional metallophosphatase/5'-nucleotidase [soil metagenome]